MKSLSRGKRASGDLIPWTISQQVRGDRRPPAHMYMHSVLYMYAHTHTHEGHGREGWVLQMLDKNIAHTDPQNGKTITVISVKVLQETRIV